MATVSKQTAQREAASSTYRTGRIHEVKTKRGLLSTKYQVSDSGKFANEVQRREAQRNS